MTVEFKLSILDFCSISPNASTTKRLEATLEHATYADRLGFHRYWITEHHTWLADASPEILACIIAANTKNIIVGTAGVLLNFYSPLKVASTFSMLETYFPKRVNLGICRGSVNPEILDGLLAGNKIEDQSETFLKKSSQLLRYVRRQEILPTINAAGDPPEVWFLGSGWNSMKLAAKSGSPYCHSIFHDTALDEPEVVNAYKRDFEHQDVKETRNPRSVLAVAGVCADTESRAHSILGDFANSFVVPHVVGTPGQCSQMLDDLQERYKADEIIFLDMCTDPVDRMRSYELLANECL